MITTAEIDNLAKLSRIKIDESEKQGLAKEIDSILAYIDQIKKATVNIDHTPIPGSVHNVMRPDAPVTTSSTDREVILAEAPQREGDFVAVKKIIAQD